MEQAAQIEVAASGPLKASGAPPKSNVTLGRLLNCARLASQFHCEKRLLLATLAAQVVRIVRIMRVRKQQVAARRQPIAAFSFGLVCHAHPHRASRELC